MYNTFNYNTQVYNTLSGLYGVLAKASVEFNSYSLFNDNVLLTRLLYEDGPVRDFNTGKVPRNDGELLIGDYWRRHYIRMEGVLKYSTAEGLENFMDDFKKNISGQNGTLDIRREDGKTRRFKATLVNTENIFSQKRAFHLTFIPFQLVFQTLEPFGEDPTLISVSDQLVVGLTHKIQTINEGSAEAKPIITVHFDAAVGLTNFQLENETTGQIIEANLTISAGDVVAINTQELTFIKNATNIDYTGEFLNLATGKNTISLSLTGTSAQYTMTVNHKTKYL